MTVSTKSGVTIGLNLLPVRPSKSGGMETYVKSLLEGIRHESTGDVQYIAYLNSELEDTIETPPEITTINTGIPAKWRPVRYAFEQLVLPWMAKIQGVDVLFCPGYVSPIISPVATVPVIHDTNYLSVPETMSTLRRLVLNAFVPLAAWTASSVVTVSEFSKSEILSATPVSSDDVSVVYNPLPPELPEPSGNGTEDVDNPYLLSVGNNYPHKNLDRLIEALPSIERELSLVIVGFSLNSDEELQRRADILDVGNRVHFCEQVSQQELANLYSGAEAYVHPSKYEGFGLPLIEAMYYETPVVAHKAAAIPEIAGDAAIYISDCKAESIAQGVAEARDEDKKEALIERGRENLDRFSLTAFINNLETTLIKSLRK